MRTPLYAVKPKDVFLLTPKAATRMVAALINRKIRTRSRAFLGVPLRAPHTCVPFVRVEILSGGKSKKRKSKH